MCLYCIVEAIYIESARSSIEIGSFSRLDISLKPFFPVTGRAFVIALTRVQNTSRVFPLELK